MRWFSGSVKAGYRLAMNREKSKFAFSNAAPTKVTVELDGSDDQLSLRNIVHRESMHG